MRHLTFTIQYLLGHFNFGRHDAFPGSLRCQTAINARLTKSQNAPMVFRPPGRSQQSLIPIQLGIIRQAALENGLVQIIEQLLRILMAFQELSGLPCLLRIWSTRGRRRLVARIFSCRTVFQRSVGQAGGVAQQHETGQAPGFLWSSWVLPIFIRTSFGGISVGFLRCNAQRCPRTARFVSTSLSQRSSWKRAGSAAYSIIIDSSTNGLFGVVGRFASSSKLGFFVFEIFGRGGEIFSRESSEISIISGSDASSELIIIGRCAMCTRVADLAVLGARSLRALLEKE